MVCSLSLSRSTRAVPTRLTYVFEGRTYVREYLEKTTGIYLIFDERLILQGKEAGGVVRDRARGRQREPLSSVQRPTRTITPLQIGFLSLPHGSLAHGPWSSHNFSRDSPSLQSRASHLFFYGGGTVGVAASRASSSSRSLPGAIFAPSSCKVAPSHKSQPRVNKVGQFLSQGPVQRVNC